MSYIKFHRGKFNVCNCDIRKGATRAPYSEWTVCPHHVNGLNELYYHGLYDLSVNGLNVLSINVRPCDIRGLNEFSVTVLKIMSVNVCPRDVIDSVNVTSESGLPSLNGVGTESSLNGLNGFNGLG